MLKLPQRNLQNKTLLSENKQNKPDIRKNGQVSQVQMFIEISEAVM